MTKEQTEALFLSVLRRDVGDSPAPPMDSLSGEDWGKVVERALGLGIAPMLYHQLKAKGALGAVSDEPRASLRSAYYRSVGKATVMFEALKAVLSELRCNAIAVIPLKGACLAELFYGNIATRPMRDIDLLVMRGDLTRAAEILERQGYEATREKGDSSQASHLPGFVKQESIIEVHWTIDGPDDGYHIDVDACWRRAVPAIIAGVEVLSLSVEDSILHLCIHAAHHDFSCHLLRFLCDIQAIVTKAGDQIDWHRLATRAQAWGAARAVCVGLGLAKEAMGLTIPHEPLSLVRPADLAWAVAWARASLMAKELRPEERPVGDNFALLVRGAVSSRRFWMVWGRLFPSRDEMAELFGLSRSSMAIPFLYPLRICRLVKRNLSGAARSLLGSRDVSDDIEARAKQLALRQWLRTGSRD